MRYIEFIVLEDRNRLFGQPKTADISQSFQGPEARGSLAESLTPPPAPPASSPTQLPAEGLVRFLPHHPTL